MDLQSNQEPLLFRLRYTCSITGKEAPKISGRDTFKLLLFTTFLTSTKVLDTKLCSWFSSYNRIEMLIQLLHLTSCTSSDMNSLYTTTNSLYFFQASVELYTRYTCRPTVKKNSNTVFRSFLKFNCHMTFTYMLQRCGQSKVCLFFPQSSPQLCGISFLFHSGLCTLPKKKKRSKSQTCVLT